MIRKRYRFVLLFCTGFTLPNWEDFCIGHSSRKSKHGATSIGPQIQRKQPSLLEFSTKACHERAERVLKTKTARSSRIDGGYSRADSSLVKLRLYCWSS